MMSIDRPGSEAMEPEATGTEGGNEKHEPQRERWACSAPSSTGDGRRGPAMRKDGIGRKIGAGDGCCSSSGDGDELSRVSIPAPLRKTPSRANSPRPDSTTIEDSRPFPGEATPVLPFHHVCRTENPESRGGWDVPRT
eukprot:scaffold1063_cov318-Pavlova_lutheri.AAC.2